jgi:hypothetical protein
MPPIDDAPVAAVGEIAGRYRDALLLLLRQKVAAPLEGIALDEAAKTAAADYRALATAVGAYNQAYEAANRAAAVGRASADAAALPRLSARLTTLQTLKRRHEAPLKPLCDNLLSLNAQKDRLEAERENLKAQLDTQTAKVATYRDAINRYLELFYADFEIARVEHNYVGGVNASFQIAINKVSVPMGDEKTPASRPSFRNTLSAGDRSTLALAFFLAQLDHDAGRERRIVVFDDPFSSQDSFRRNQTAIEVARVANRCAQVIVLSHDAHFLKRVQEKVQDHAVKFLKLSPIGEDTQITELDLAALLRSELRAHIDALQTFYRTNEAGAGRPRSEDPPSAGRSLPLDVHHPLRGHRQSRRHPHRHPLGRRCPPSGRPLQRAQRPQLLH